MFHISNLSIARKIELSTIIVASRGVAVGNRIEVNSPTAVYLLRMWYIIIAVIIIATIWMKHVANRQRTSASVSEENR